jgi:hypothetical protein
MIIGNNCVIFTELHITYEFCNNMHKSLKGVPLKYYLVIIILFGITVTSYSSIKSSHPDLCEGRSHCKAIIVPLNKEVSGSCTGVLFNEYNCKINYHIGDENLIEVNCLSMSNKPLYDYSMYADSIGYNIFAIVEEKDEEVQILNDENYYLNIFNMNYYLKLVQHNENDLIVTTGQLYLISHSTSYEMTDVVCVN